MQRIRFCIFGIIIWFHSNLFAQDILYARACIKTLCSEDFFGRGYVQNGDKIAANFIRQEFTKNKVLPLGERYFQSLGFPVIYYPNEVSITLDDKPVFAGNDYIINPGCPSIKGRYKVLEIDSTMVDNLSEFNRIKALNLKNYFLVLDNLKGKNFRHPERAEQFLQNTLQAKGLIYKNNRSLVWSLSMEFAPYPILYFKTGTFPNLVLKMDINIDAAHKVHGTQNVIGYIKGSVQPDSFIVYSAHYDHLGKMGNDAMFPGANDNASGVAMMLDMAKYYAKNPPPYSVAFIAFAGEEIGLVGSYYFVENPLIPLDKISLLINMDLMSTGDEGLTAVNATEFPFLFEQLKLCNLAGQYLPDIAARGKSANSDHHYFTEAGVPSFFFYLRGNYHHYHDVDDTYDAITMSRYNEAFKLIVDFADWRMNFYQNKSKK